MKRIHYNYLRPPFYYQRLFVFFLLLSALLSFQLIIFTQLSLADYFLIVIVVLLLFLTIGAFIEYLKKGEYMSPLEVYDVVGFIKELQYARKHNDSLDEFFLSYVKKPKKVYSQFVNKKKKFTLSTIAKHNGFYEVTLLDEAKVVEYLFFRFFTKKATIHLRLKKVKGEFKIVSISN